MEIRHVLVLFMKTQDLNITGVGSTRMPTSQTKQQQEAVISSCPPFTGLFTGSLWLEKCVSKQTCSITQIRIPH